MSKGQFLAALQEGVAKAAAMPKCRGCGKMLEAWEQDPMQGGNVLGLCVPRATKQTGLFWEQAEAALTQRRCMTLFLIWASQQVVMVDGWLEAGGREAVLEALQPRPPQGSPHAIDNLPENPNLNPNPNPHPTHTREWLEWDEDDNERYWNQQHPNGPAYRRRRWISNGR